MRIELQSAKNRANDAIEDASDALSCAPHRRDRVRGSADQRLESTSTTSGNQTAESLLQCRDNMMSTLY
jgi:hypothetical protein